MSSEQNPSSKSTSTSSHEVTEIVHRGADSWEVESREIERSEIDNLSTKNNKKENRNIVTPYAFGVSDALLGTPLALPSQRGMALIIDMLLVAILTSLNSISAAGVASWICFKASNREELNVSQGRRRKFIRGLGYLLLFGFVVSLYEVFDEQFASQTVIKDPVPLAQSKSVPATQTAAETTAQRDEEIIPITDDITINLSDLKSQLQEDAEAQEKAPPSFLAYIQGFLADLGLSFGFSAMYFTVMTAWYRGQTPGKKLLGIKVIKLDGSTMGLWESFGRYGGYGAGLATGLLGFLQMFWDNNRQAIQDKISETLVVDARRAKRTDWNTTHSNN